MNCEQWRERFTDFIEESLPASQHQQMAAHLRQCPDCARELDAFRRAVAALRELPTVAAPQDLPVRIRQALPVQQRVFGYRISWQGVGAVATAACLLVGFWAIFSYQRPTAITARRAVGWGPATPAQRAEAPTEVAKVAEAPEAETLPPSLPSESKPATAPSVSPPTPPPVRVARHPEELPAPPSLKGEVEMAPPAPPLGAAIDATVPSPPLAEAEGVMAHEAAAPEPPEAMALARAPAGPAPLAGGAGRLTFDASGNAAEKAVAGAYEETAGVKVTVIPPKQRVVGQEAVVKVKIEPEVDVAQAVVRVRPQGTLHVTLPEGIVYRGPLKGGESTTVTFAIIATASGTQQLTVELASELPGITASVPVSIPDFRQPQPPPAAHHAPTEGNQAAEPSDD